MKTTKVVKTENQTDIYILWQLATGVHNILSGAHIIMKEKVHIIYRNAI